MKLESLKFADGETVPIECVYGGCGGGNVSPDLSWSDAPEGTKSFALLCHDPDAPTGTGFYHWTMWNIPASATGLAAGAGNKIAQYGFGKLLLHGAGTARRPARGGLRAA